MYTVSSALLILKIVQWGEGKAHWSLMSNLNQCKPLLYCYAESETLCTVHSSIPNKFCNVKFSPCYEYL